MRGWGLAAAGLALAVAALAVSVLVVEAQTQAPVNATLFFNVRVPSRSENALIDGFAVSALTLAAIASAFLLHRRPVHLLLSGIAVVSLSVVMMAARTVVPVGAYVNETTMTVMYVYDVNTYARLYLAPAILSIFNIALALLRMLEDVIRRFSI